VRVEHPRLHRAHSTFLGHRAPRPAGLPLEQPRARVERVAARAAVLERQSSLARAILCLVGAQHHRSVRTMPAAADVPLSALVDGFAVSSGTGPVPGRPATYAASTRPNPASESRAWPIRIDSSGPT
jgi:hypothetical protein